MNVRDLVVTTVIGYLLMLPCGFLLLAVVLLWREVDGPPIPVGILVGGGLVALFILLEAGRKLNRLPTAWLGRKLSVAERVRFLTILGLIIGVAALLAQHGMRISYLLPWCALFWYFYHVSRLETNQ